MPDVPTLTTERLTLRGPAEADFDAMRAFGGSPRSAFIGASTDEFEVFRALLAGIGHWALRGYGFFTVVMRDSGEIAGRVGILNYRGWPEPELGWHVFDGFEGRGIAHEAAVAARAWAAKSHGLTRLISLIDASNTRSIALAKRLGATFERDAEVLGLRCQLWRHIDMSPDETGEAPA